jgi:hypothetical protein
MYTIRLKIPSINIQKALISHVFKTQNQNHPFKQKTPPEQRPAFNQHKCIRPYPSENTTSRPICQVKHWRAHSVLRSETSLER